MLLDCDLKKNGKKDNLRVQFYVFKQIGGKFEFVFNDVRENKTFPGKIDKDFTVAGPVSVLIKFSRRPGDKQKAEAQFHLEMKRVPGAFSSCEDKVWYRHCPCQFSLVTVRCTMQKMCLLKLSDKAGKLSNEAHALRESPALQWSCLANAYRAGFSPCNATTMNRLLRVLVVMACLCSTDHSVQCEGQAHVQAVVHMSCRCLEVR